MSTARVYLDHNATTPLAPEVLAATSHALAETFGNASSVHLDGQRAKAAVEEARAAVAALVGGAPREIVFTSGGTESDNLALRGAVEALAPRGRAHLVASAIEHDAVRVTVGALARHGVAATIVAPSADGVVQGDAFARALRDDTAIASVMLANNETGAVQPVAALAALARERGALFHTDAVQAVGKLPIDVHALGVDLLALSAHKIGGPKGVGALWVRPGTPLHALHTGGKQERNRRAGTENVPAIVGFGVAASLALARLATEPARQLALRDRLERGLLASVPEAVVNGHGAPRVPNTANLAFPGVDAEALLIALDLEGIAVSTGSACSSGALSPSHVLKAMGIPPARLESALRFSLGTTTTEADIDRVLDTVPRVVARLRALRAARAGVCS